MNILSRITNRFQRRDVSGGGIFGVASGYGNTAAGKRIDEEAARKIATAAACVRIISTQMALLPCFVYKRRPGGGKDRLYDHPLHIPLHFRPNPIQSNFDFKTMMTAWACLTGNAYAYKQMYGAGQYQLWPLCPNRVTPEWTSAEKREVRYKFTDENGKEHIFSRDQVFHLRWLSSDGLKGRSPVEDAKEPLAVAMAGEEYVARFFSNGARPPGALKLKTPLKKEAKDQLKKDWQDAYGGVANAWKTPVLEGDLDWQSFGMTNDQGQVDQIIRLNIPQICRIWGVPPHMVADLSRATNNNIEHQGLEFYKSCLMPWKVCWEQCLMLSFFEEQELRDYLIEHVEEAILMGDIKSRNEALQIQRQNGVINADEWREKINMNPIESGEGKIYMVNSAMQPVGAAAKPQPDKEPENEPGRPADDEDGEEGDEQDRELTLNELRKSFAGLFSDVLARLRRKEAKAAAAALRAGKALSFVEEFYPKHRDAIRDGLVGSVATFCNLADALGATVRAGGLGEFADAQVKASMRAVLSSSAELEVQAWEKGAPAGDVEQLLRFLIEENHEQETGIPSNSRASM